MLHAIRPIIVCFAVAAIAVFAAPDLGTAAPQEHVRTADFLGYSATEYPWSTYALSLTWADVPQSIEPGVQAAGIRTLLYTDPNRQASGQPLFTSDETTFAHTCSGSRITSTTVPGIYLMDPASTDLRDLWVDYVEKIRYYAHYDAVLEDDADDVIQTSALPCNYTPAMWTDESVTRDSYVKSQGINIVYNGLAILGPNDSISPSIALNSASIGGILEQCYARAGTTNAYVASTVWRTFENTEIAMAHANKLMFCYADNWSYPDSHALALRMYVYASYLLTYDPYSTVLWETFPTPSGYHVNPETQLVALYPSASISSIDQLHTSTNVYARTYGACYIHGKLIGACTSVVNPGYVAHAWPFAPGRYNHTLVIGGADLLDQGYLSAAGPAPPATLAPMSAVIAFQ